MERLDPHGNFCVTVDIQAEETPARTAVLAHSRVWFNPAAPREYGFNVIHRHTAFGEPSPEVN
jgi:hypothetical protein